MGKFDLENFPTSESAKRMLGYVTKGFYNNSYVGKWIFQIMGAELDITSDIAKDLPVQFFPESATWGLMYHELKWGLPVRENLTYEERRRLICRKRDYRAPMTPERMEKYLENATGFETHIADITDPGEYGFVASHPNVFKAYFLGEGTLDSKLVREILNQLKQSHTAYTVNDRTEMIVDNRSLEQIILRNIYFKMAVSFWHIYVYDGSWLLDGSVYFSAKRRYSLMLGLKNNQWSFYASEQFKLYLLKLKTKLNNSELFYAKVRHSFGIIFWNVRCFDDSWKLDGSKLFDAKRSYELFLGIRNAFEIESETENIKLKALNTRWSQKIRENIVVKMFYRFAADFWRINYLCGESLLDGEILFNSNRC